MSAYSAREVARIFHISPARLRYWERTALIETSARAPGGGSFGFRDLVRIKTVLSLLRRGVPLRRIRRSLEAVRDRLPELDQPLEVMDIWPGGSDRVVVRHHGAVLEPDGQVLLDFRDPPGTPVASLDEARRVARGSEPEVALAWFEHGCRLDVRRETQPEAIEAYQRALEADPEFADAHCNLGTVHYQLGDQAAARACYERALACDAGHVEANLNLAGLLEDQGEDARALELYREALRRAPLRADVHLAAALLYEKLRERKRAREHWRRYLQLDPLGAWAEVARKRLRE